MRKTLIALFAVPALAGFAFAAPAVANTIATQAVTVTIPVYLNMAATIAATEFNFTANGLTTATNGLLPANLTNYTAQIEASTASVKYGPTTPGKSTVNVKSNSKKYSLTANMSVVTGTAAVSADFLIATVSGPTAASYLPFNSPIALMTVTDSKSWSGLVDVYFGLNIPVDTTYDFATMTNPTTWTLTYTLAQP